MTTKNNAVETKSVEAASLKYAKTVEVEGKEFTLQKLPVRPALEIRSRCRDKNGNPDDIKLYEELLEHVVVSPKMKLDDFEDVNTLEELMKKVLEYQYQGKK